jgi:triacylglycerol esterase/lipase EstA (alpha/beta hydrolase family)
MDQLLQILHYYQKYMDMDLLMEQELMDYNRVQQYQYYHLPHHQIHQEDLLDYKIHLRHHLLTIFHLVEMVDQNKNQTQLHLDYFGHLSLPHQNQ